MCITTTSSLLLECDSKHLPPPGSYLTGAKYFDPETCNSLPAAQTSPYHSLLSQTRYTPRLYEQSVTVPTRDCRATRDCRQCLPEIPPPVGI